MRGGSPVLQRVGSSLRRLGDGFLTFLEIIGLRQERSTDVESRLSRIKLRYFHFRNLLSANNELLEHISEMEARLASGSPLTLEEVRARALLAQTSAHRMVTSFATLSGGKFPAVDTVLARLQQRISACLKTEPAKEGAPLVISLQALDLSHAAVAGHKMAALGEIRNRVNLPVPDGFAITAAAFHRALQAACPAEPSRSPGEAGAREPREARAALVREGLLAADLPEDVAQAVCGAYGHLDGGRKPLVAVRSSALDEDRDASFAGQYLTRLNVAQDQLLSAYREVLASAYEPEVLFYRQSLGFEESDPGVAVGCMVMVEALASGVAFSRDPRGEAPDKVLIHAAWGLGCSVADGKVNPDVYRVARDQNAPAVEVRASRKASRTVGLTGGGVVDELVPEEQQMALPLETHEARVIAAWAVRLEEYFGAPQDVEWAMDGERRLFVLQSRPGRSAASQDAQAPPVEGAQLLLEEGDTASPGAGAGPVFIPDAEGRLEGFPEGGVLVVRHSSPRYVRAMKKASAIVADVGSAIGHMASLSREFGIPTLVGASRATALLEPGAVVTVDATRHRVYAGRVEPLLSEAGAHLPRPPRSEAYQALSEVARYVVPLTLTDPKDPGFTPLNCRSLHDLARYLHEKSFQEMFGIGQLAGDVRHRTPLLDIFLPVDLYIIDLGGGLDAPPGARKVKRSQVRSVPFAAMLEGMLHKDIPRFGPRAMDAKGFMHVVMRQAFAGPDTDGSLRDPSYAIISDKYVNLATRVGFHFSVVDAYCAEGLNQNYITFRFKGGAADKVRRVRRVRAIAEILKALGFEATVANDLVAAQFLKHDEAETLKALEMLGRLLQFMRQMDAAMTSDEVVGQIVENFLAGRFGGAS